jgi:multidrug efflux pump subunit AcrA (membrane-fusion protein)
MSKLYRISLAALMLPALFLVGCRRSETRADDPPPIEIKAMVHPAQSAAVAAQIDGQVTSIHVAVGTAVAAGTPIAALSNATVERDAAVAHANLAWIETRLRRGGKAPVVAAPRQSRSNLEITSRILQIKKERLDKLRQLRKTSDVTTQEVEQAEAEYLFALRDYNQMRSGGPSVAAAGDDTQLLRIERDKAAAEDKFAAQRRGLLQVTSPIAGTVTRLAVTQGQAVFPRDVIAEVSDVATLHVTGGVAPELLRYIKPGMPVQVKIFSVPPRTFADEIDSIIPAAPDSRTATVVVSIPNPDRSLQSNIDAVISLRTP